MDIQTQKLQLIKWLASLQDQSTVRELVQWKEDHQRISREQYNQELEESNKRIEAGNYTSHEEVMKESGSWLK